MADDKKEVPVTGKPTEPPKQEQAAPVTEQPAPVAAEPTVAEAEPKATPPPTVEAPPKETPPAEKSAPAEKAPEAVPKEPPAPVVEAAPKGKEVSAPTEEKAPPTKAVEAAPKEAPAPAVEKHAPTEKAEVPKEKPGSKVLDFAAARGKTEKAPPKEKTAPADKTAPKPKEAGKPGKSRPPKVDKAAPAQSDPLKPEKPAPTKAEPKRDKMSQSKPPEEKAAPAPKESPAAQEQPAPRDATRKEKEEIVYLNLSQLRPFKNHPFGVRDDAEMQGLVESVRAGGVNQPALVRPTEDGGYEIIAGHRRQRASELAGFANMPCIVRNMTDDEAILAMTDDNLRHREKILPTEKAKSLKMQVEAIKHQGSRPGEDDKDAGKRSTQIVGDRNGMNYKQVQRYIRLNELVPDLQKMLDGKQLSFTPAVEISFIRPKLQKYIAVAIEGQQSSPSLSQAQKLRELDKDGKLNGDIIDGILSEQKKEVDKVIINGAELEKYFGKEMSPREMKDKIMSLLDDWKAKQPSELGKPEKKTEKAL